MINRCLAIVIHLVFVVGLSISLAIISPPTRGQGQQTSGDQTEVAANNEQPKVAQPDLKMGPITPVYSEFMGVRLGMNAEEVRQKLGNPKDKGERQDLFMFSDVNSAQVFYDDQQKVTAISVDYIGENSGAPVPEKVVGVAIEAKADGSMYELRRYPEAGYWVAYSRTAGKNPLTTVTIKKI